MRLRLCLQTVARQASPKSQIAPADPKINAVVAASAGTGKTYLLVTRMIRLLLAGARPEGILALTFTRKAAAEMRARLFDRLSEMALLEDPDLQLALSQLGLATTRVDLLQARNLFEVLLFDDQGPRITTFHAFCQELLHRFPLEADVPAGYDLLENTGLVEEMAWDALCLEATRQPECQLATALHELFTRTGGLSNSHDALIRGFLGHRSDWWAYTEQQHDPVPYAIEALDKKLQSPRQPLQSFFSTDRCRALTEYADLLQLHATTSNLTHSQAIHNSQSDALSLQEKFRLTQSALLTQTGQPRQQKITKTLAAKLNPAQQKRFLQLHTDLSESVLQTLEGIHRLNCFEMNRAWYLAGQALLNHYQDIKQRLGALDFTDLEWRTYKLLHSSEQALWVQYKLDQKIDHLLLDEFQDTNPTQWQLLLPLLEEMAGGQSEYPRSSFLVGDSKQSIYGFRRANPQLQEIAGQWLKKNLNAEIFPLSKSWRSAPAIIDYVNTVFGSQNQAPPLTNFSAHDTYQKDLWGEIRLYPAVIPVEGTKPIPPKLRDPLTEARVISQNSCYYNEGLVIADAILQLVSEKRLIIKQAEQKVLCFDDIIVLLRNRTHAADYERAFQDKCLPFTGIKKGGFLDSLEVLDIEALMKILITPFDNLALAQVLRSPIFSATDADLQLLAVNPTTIWYKKLLQIADKNNCPPPLQRAARLLLQWRFYIRELPVHDLIDRIFFEGDIINRYRLATSSNNQAKVIANLQQVIELSLQFNSGRYPGITRFLGHLKLLRTKTAEISEAPTTASDTAKIRLLTIHAAKGLESPVVFLADCGSTVRSNSTFNAIVDWPARRTRPHFIALAPRKAESPALLNELRDKQINMERTEEANLLYVALTRAKHMLVLSAAAKSEKALNHSWYELLSDSLKQLPGVEEDGFLRYQSGQIDTDNEPPVENNETEDCTVGPPLYFSDTKTVTSPSSSTPELKQPRGTLILSNRLQALRYGSCLHKAIEKLSGPNASRSINFNEPVFNPFKPTELKKIQTKASQIISNQKFSFLFDTKLYEQAYKELPVCYRNRSGNYIYGFIDRLVLYQNEAWIVDFKNVADESEASEIPANFKMQLDYYTQGISKIWPQRKIRQAILFTQSEKLVIVN